MVAGNITKETFEQLDTDVKLNVLYDMMADILLRVDERDRTCETRRSECAARYSKNMEFVEAIRDYGDVAKKVAVRTIVGTFITGIIGFIIYHIKN